MTTIYQSTRSQLITHPLPEDVQHLVQECVTEIRNKLEFRPSLGMLYGRLCTQNRNVGFFSDESRGYKYSNTFQRSQPLPPILAQLLHYINDRFGTQYNGILVNEYITGEDYVSPHSDNETNLDPTGGVLAISYGASRKFVVRDKHSKAQVCTMETHSDEIIQMAGDFQKEFTHEIPVQRRVKDARISFTFRVHVKDV